MCDVWGLHWAVGGASETKFLNLWLHLVAVEVQLAVEGCDLDSISNNTEILCSCFVIMETTISTLSKCEDEQSGHFDAETILQLHTALNEAFSSVVLLLEIASHQMSEGDPEEASPSSSNTSSSIAGLLLSKYIIVTAAVRVLGVWLAEDSLSLTEKVYNLLPFLLRLACSTRVCVDTGGKEEHDLLKFLLPGLCHLTVDDKARPVLMKSGLPRVLAGYMEDLAKLLGASSEMEDRFCLCCGLLQNVCVTSPQDVRKFKESFSHITSILAKTIASSASMNEATLLNVVVLFVMMVRRGIQIDNTPSLWSPVFSTLMTAMGDESDRNESSELRFIGAQELASLVKEDPSIQAQNPSKNGCV